MDISIYTHAMHKNKTEACFLISNVTETHFQPEKKMNEILFQTWFSLRR